MTCADKIYKVWDLKNYEHLYSIHDNNIYEIKISPVSAQQDVLTTSCLLSTLRRKD